MHEASFIDAVLKDIEDLAKSEGFSIADVSSVVLEVGELAGIEDWHLRKHVVDRLGEGVDVEVLTSESKVLCECGYSGRPRILERLHDFVIFECLRCEGIPEVIRGKDIKILKVIYS